MKVILTLATLLVSLSWLGTPAYAQFYVGGGAYMGQGGGSCMPAIPRSVAKIEKSEQDLGKKQDKIEK